jgi:hypothetical protein
MGEYERKGLGEKILLLEGNRRRKQEMGNLSF